MSCHKEKQQFLKKKYRPISQFSMIEKHFFYIPTHEKFSNITQKKVDSQSEPPPRYMLDIVQCQYNTS